MSQNALSRKVNGNGKVILDTHPESDQHQNWTCSTGSPTGPTHQIWWWSMNPFLRYLADKNSAHRHTDTRRWPQDLAAYGAQVIIIIYLSNCNWIPITCNCTCNFASVESVRLWFDMHMKHMILQCHFHNFYCYVFINHLLRKKWMWKCMPSAPQ